MKFKTNINCGGCIATVKPHLDSAVGADRWSVDITNKDKILTVTTNDVTEAQVINTIEKAGYRIELIHQ